MSARAIRIKMESKKMREKTNLIQQQYISTSAEQ